MIASGAVQRRALVALVALLALGGCTVGPSQRPPVAVRGDTLPAAPPPVAAAPTLPVPDGQNTTIDFEECTDDVLPGPPPPDRALRVECARMSVPTDPDLPGSSTSTVGVWRVGLADAPADRPPLLLLGDSATEPSAQHAVTVATAVPRAVLERFTLIGLDRRGTGADTLSCAAADTRAALVDAGAATDPDLALVLEHARAVVQDCYRQLSGEIGGFRTASTAADVEQLRTELGVARLSGVGVGDGAGALTRWAATSPGSVGRLVLDGPPDPGLDDPERAEARAGAVEAAFDAFAVACTAGGGCPLAPDPRAAVLSLLDALRDQPLAAPDGRRLTAGGTVTALLATLGEPRSWPQLATALAAARSGDPVGVLALLDPVLGPGGRFDPMLATACNDSARRLSPVEVGELATRWRSQYPLAGGTLALQLLACAPWPAGASSAPVVPGADVPPILVIGTALDPRGPAAGSRRAADELPMSRFVSWQGAGTGAYPRTPCVTDQVNLMLLEGALPDPGTLCPP